MFCFSLMMDRISACFSTTTSISPIGSHERWQLGTHWLLGRSHWSEEMEVGCGGSTRRVKNQEQGATALLWWDVGSRALAQLQYWCCWRRRPAVCLSRSRHRLGNLAGHLQLCPEKCRLQKRKAPINTCCVTLSYVSVWWPLFYNEK